MFPIGPIPPWSPVKPLGPIGPVSPSTPFCPIPPGSPLLPWGPIFPWGPVAPLSPFSTYCILTSSVSEKVPAACTSEEETSNNALVELTVLILYEATVIISPAVLP